MKDKELQFNQVVREHKSTIYTVCLMFSEDADRVEDLVQETLINIWQGFNTFEHRSNIRTWIWRIAMNTCISEERKRKRRPESSNIDALCNKICSSDDAREKQQVQMLYDRIHRLALMDRAIVLLWLENQTYEEIGKIIGISAKNVSVRLVRIRQQLMNMNEV